MLLRILQHHHALAVYKCCGSAEFTKLSFLIFQNRKGHLDKKIQYDTEEIGDRMSLEYFPNPLDNSMLIESAEKFEKY